MPWVDYLKSGQQMLGKLGEKIQSSVAPPPSAQSGNIKSANVTSESVTSVNVPKPPAPPAAGAKPAVSVQRSSTGTPKTAQGEPPRTIAKAGQGAARAAGIPSAPPAPASPPAAIQEKEKPSAHAEAPATEGAAGSDKHTDDATPASEKKDNTPIKVEDERSLALSGGIQFKGIVLTVEGGPLSISPQSRGLCALFDNGTWLVSAAHRNSPLVTSVATQAKRAGFKVSEPRYVTPDIITQAYLYGARMGGQNKFDENSVRRKIVDTLNKAVELGTNDVHIEVSGGRTKIEFRIDGQLRNFETWTRREGELVLSSIYSHSVGQSGSTANWMEPQAAMLTQATGPDTITLPTGVLSVRCQWVPLADGGRYLDMRLQYDSAHLFGENFVMADVDSLGFNQEQLRIIRQMRQVPGGLRVFSGPVNQGKTTTLRVMLNRRMSETNYSLNCLMIEDPPEGGVLGARQIGVSATVNDEQREKSFVEIMRCALRLDPDIVMLGEVRDIQTAKFAFRLALTGRQVYTTTHVYAALAIPQRFRDIGIEPYLVYDQHLLQGLICQRLLRGLCPHCRIPLVKAHEELGPEYRDVWRRVRAGLAIVHARRSKENPNSPWQEKLVEPDVSQCYVANPDGCPECFKGRVGRTVCAEVIATDAKLMALLGENKMQDAEDYWLSPWGMNGLTMLWHGLEKVRYGHVCPVDAEFELGPMALERDMHDVENVLGTLG
ncbi:MAG: hypothetical protein EBZ69_02360 [Alphaproteobacteria bacterium]|nr:hypothetical protein [Alphaproteobacteria bacterium]